MEAGTGGTWPQPRDAWGTRSWKRQQGPSRTLWGDWDLDVRTLASRLGEDASLWRGWFWLRVSVVEAGCQLGWKRGWGREQPRAPQTPVQASALLPGWLPRCPRSLVRTFVQDLAGCVLFHL